MSAKYDIQLGDVQETLLLPLTARVLESKKEDGILHDPKSVEISQRINFDFKKTGRDISEIGVAGLVARALKFDHYIKDFQTKHPYGKILTLGVGLDTYFYRCDNGTNIWYDLDLPDSIELREKLLPVPSERVYYIRKSLFDTTWIDDIGSIEVGLLILAPGVFPYFEEDEIKSLLNQIAPRLRGAEIVFDVISQLGILLVNTKIHEAGMKNANLKWGIIEVGDIERWNDNLELVEAQPFFKDISDLKRYDLINKVVMKINDFLSISQVVKLKFI